MGQLFDMQEVFGEKLRFEKSPFLKENDFDFLRIFKDALHLQLQYWTIGMQKETKEALWSVHLAAKI